MNIPSRLNQPHRIIIHHSATKDSGTVSWGAIRRYHTVDRGWSDIGYHAGIEYARDAYECFYGRSTLRPGAHTRGHNNNTLGFCFVGDYDAEEPTEEMMRLAVQRVLIPWMMQYGLAIEDLHPHSEYADKSCPGTKFDMQKLKDIVATEVAKLAVT